MTGGPFFLSDELRQATNRLRDAGIEGSATDARLLIAAAAGLSREEMFYDPNLKLSPDQKTRAETMIHRRADREPVSRILGRREFYGLSFEVTPVTLDPRPDSEVIVEAAIDYALCMGGKLTVLDIGTGTGCLLLSTLEALPEAIGTGTDIDPEAVAAACRNAHSLGCASRVKFQTSDWLSGVQGRFDIVLSNPPYIPSGDIANLAPEVSQYDPWSALDGGSDGLDAYRVLADRIPETLAPSGVALMEIGAGQADDVTGLFSTAGWHILENRADLAGHDRCLVFARKTAPNWLTHPPPKKGVGNRMDPH